MSSNVKIAISGKSGCGNTTVSSLVSDRLGLRLINYTFHSIAVEMGISFDEVCRRAEEDNIFDYRVDKKQVELAMRGNCVLGSRLAIWLLESADLKVYLQAGPRVRALRIQDREGGVLDNVLAATENRDARDKARYLNLYDINIDEYQHADVIIDAEKYDQNQIADIIVGMAKDLAG